MTREEIGSILKELRISSGKTQKEVAKILGRTQQIVGHWETGYSQPDADTLFTLCDIYGTTVDEAFGFKKESASVSQRDITFLSKYHALDPYGQETVNLILNRETERIKTIKNLSTQVKEKDTYIAQLEALAKKSDTPATPAILEFPRQPDRLEKLLGYYYSASAGGGVFILGDEDVEQVRIPDVPGADLADYAIKISGDSMEPDFYDGEVALVSQNISIKHGDVGIFIIDGKAYIKEYGKTELISRNPKSANINISDYANIVCMGKVVGKVREDDLIRM